MATSYRAQVATAFEVLADGLAPLLDRRMSVVYPDDEWILVAATKLGKRPDVVVSLSDPHFQLEVMSRWWGPAFAPVFDDEARQLVNELRTARNHWAHPDEDHPFDVDYSTKVVQQGEDLLRAAGSPEAGRMAAIIDDIRWQEARERATHDGSDIGAALMQQLAELQQQYGALQEQLDQARDVARSATGRSRAVSRQLAELQTQYAAVSGLREEYRTLQRRLEAERVEASPEDGPPSGRLRDELASAEMSLVGLQRESDLLRDQLAHARRGIAEADPLDTEAGRRWLWLVASLILTMGILVVLAASLGTGGR
jgi:hypothetical protein